jgi:site-specific recombinase XerD
MITLDRFGAEYQQYNELSAGRRSEQAQVIRALEDFTGNPAEQASAAEIRRFLAGLSEDGAHVNTVRKKLHMLKPFFKWAWQAKLIDAETYMEIQHVAPPQKSSSQGLPRPYKRKELDKFWAELDAKFPRLDGDYYWRRFDRGSSRFRRVRKDAMRAQLEAIVALALQCGLRRSEIFQASLDDIHHDNEYVVVRFGKGGKEREVPHTEVSRTKVREWIEVRHRLKPRHGATWLSLWGTKKKDWSAPMSFSRFERLMLNIGSGWELHRFRHTCGTTWLRTTGRIELVKKLLGHSKISQTEGYAEVVRDDLARAMRNSELEFEAQTGAEAVAA